jgi:hypothetical protein
MLSPEDLVALFDETPATKVGEREVFAEMDFLVPAEMLQHHIERLKKLTAASKFLWKELSKHIMKLRTIFSIADPSETVHRRNDQHAPHPNNSHHRRDRLALHSWL